MVKLVGILNITPDSFSDGRRFLYLDTALQHVEQLIQDGASVIDIGAESTRPAAHPIDATIEWQRLELILKHVIPLIKAKNVQISLDSYRASTAERAIDMGVDWINDVSGGQDQAMIPLLQRNPGIRYVWMHNLGVPAHPLQCLPEHADCLPTIHRWFKEKIESYALNPNQIILDPGIGFGKTAEQSWHILRNIDYFRDLSFPLMVGHSRKSLFRLISHKLAQERDIETATTSVYLAKAGVDYIRVHNVDLCKRALSTAQLMDLQLHAHQEKIA